MEIERKFLIDRFPEGMEPYECAVVEQGYLSMEPEVRIRKKFFEGKDYCKLCVKSGGTLAREEVEVDISPEQYCRLCAMLTRSPLKKDYRVYDIGNGLSLECSAVTVDGYPDFMYAEVEFGSEEEARVFVPPAYLGREVTEEPKMKMKYFYFGIAE